jgi:hypothetical protein
MLSALVMAQRLILLHVVAFREEGFGKVLGAALALVAVGTITFRLATDWSWADSLYVSVATLTTSSILDPTLTISDPWLKLFVVGYVLVGIGILVELARRLGTAFIVARAEASGRMRQLRRDAGNAVDAGTARDAGDA